jgi:iron(III) transport system substrate-binding protein
VAFFTGTARYPQAAASKLEQAFEKKYGFPLKVTFAAIGPHPTVVQQLRSEASSGVKPAADLFPTALSLSKMLREGDAIEAVDWAKLGAPAGVAVASESVVMINVISRNVIYNTNQVKKADVPRRLEDLADPKWRGKIVAPAIGDAFAMMVPVLGEEKTAQLVQKLVTEQKMVLVQTITDVATKVASGEYAIGFGVPADWSGTRSKGAPIDNAPLEKVSGQPFYASVLKNAPHPAAARMFGIFICCTVEGQKALNDALGWSKFEMAGSESNEIGGGGRGVYPTIDFQLNHQRRVASELGKRLSP